MTNILKYIDKRAGVVCQCGGKSGAKKHSPSQSNTLIPWARAHSAMKNAMFHGVFGRLDWDGFFRTTISNPDPSSKQGCVLHPSQVPILPNTFFPSFIYIYIYIHTHIYIYICVYVRFSLERA
jgi:hypothetical protein